MGICINYAFARREVPEHLLKAVERYAVKLGMVIRARSWNRLLIHPAPGCETLDLHWHKWKTIKTREGWSYVKAITANYEKELKDEDWICASFTKTQYAGLKCHVLVAELLRFVASRCRLADVFDEAGYYELASEHAIKRVMESFDRSSKAISDIAGFLKETFGTENVVCAADLSD